MQIILGTPRHQMQFISLEDGVAADNPVRIVDAFVEKLDIVKLGFVPQQQETKPRPGGAPRFGDKFCVNDKSFGVKFKLFSPKVFVTV